MLSFPYQSKPCLLYDDKQIINQIKQAVIREPIEKVYPNTNLKLFFIPPKQQFEDIVNFTQFVNIGTPNDLCLVIDGRSYFKYESRSDDYKALSPSDWEFQKTRLLFSYKFLLESGNFIRRFGEVPLIVFSNWIKSVLTRRYGLDIVTSTRVAIISAYYYIAQYDSEVGESKDCMSRLRTKVTQVCRSDFQTVNDVIESVDKLTTADDLINAIKNYSGTIKLDGLKYADLFTLLSPSFYGLHSRENIGVALEHLPTFVAMLYRAIVDRSYKRSLLTQITENEIKPNELAKFKDLVITALHIDD